MSRLGLSGQGLLVLSPDTVVRPPGPQKEPGHAWRLQLRAKEGQRLTFRALFLPSLMVGHVKRHGHGEDQRDRDHAEVSHYAYKHTYKYTPAHARTQTPAGTQHLDTGTKGTRHIEDCTDTEPRRPQAGRRTTQAQAHHAAHR
eukprot:scaffold10940_cov139-Isochrysis_galbana.AAC.4